MSLLGREDEVEEGNVGAGWLALNVGVFTKDMGW